MEPAQRITRDELEQKFRTLQTDIQGRAQDKKQSVIATASAVAGAMVLLAYVFGRRSGRRSGSRIEFRRS